MAKQITPEQIEKTLREVVQAARETDLIGPSYLDMIEGIIPQMYRRHARQQVKAALMANKASLATHKVKTRRAKTPE